MSQPLDQRAHHEPLGELDKEAGEFWMANPWEPRAENLSAFERNRALLNLGNGRFADVSHLTTADLESDSRAVAVGDITGDGMQDLLVRSVGGGPLRLFENRWPQTHWLKVSLRGKESNGRGLGARLKLETGEKTLWREVSATNSFQSQLPALVHFGLKDKDRVDRLTVEWPSGTVQVLEGLPVDRHLRITEGSATPKRVDEPSVSETAAVHDTEPRD